MWSTSPGAMFLRAWIAVRLARSRDEQGLSTAEWVALTAVVVGGALAIGAIVINKFTSSAQGIPTP